MTDERQSGVLFESWLKDTDPMPPDARPNVARVMAKVPRTRQRGRWWPLPAFERPRMPAIPSRELAPAPIPPTSGPTPARGYTMFSALKFITAGVIVALFGGFLLAGVLQQPSEDLVPAAVTASPSPDPAPVAVTASPMTMPEWDRNLAPVFFEGEADWTRHGGGCLSVGNPGTTSCGGKFTGSMEASDPRLDGQVAANAMGALGVVRIGNERGAWSGALGAAPVDGEEVAGMRDASRFSAWLVGEGAYEGLNAFIYATLVSAEDEGDHMQWTIEGWVFDEEPWTAPVSEE